MDKSDENKDGGDKGSGAPSKSDENWPSKTDNPSGGGRDNAPSKGK